MSKVLLKEFQLICMQLVRLSIFRDMFDDLLTLIWRPHLNWSFVMWNIRKGEWVNCLAGRAGYWVIGLFDSLRSNLDSGSYHISKPVTEQSQLIGYKFIKDDNLSLAWEMYITKVHVKWATWWLDEHVWSKQYTPAGSIDSLPLNTGNSNIEKWKWLDSIVGYVHSVETYYTRVYEYGPFDCLKYTL